MRLYFEEQNLLQCFPQYFDIVIATFVCYQGCILMRYGKYPFSLDLFSPLPDENRNTHLVGMYLFSAHTHSVFSS